MLKLTGLFDRNPTLDVLRWVDTAPQSVMSACRGG
jgi:hypothetical protein